MAYKIVLDAGHGGEDPGAVYKERKEKDDNLKLTLAVGKILEENGVDVVYTRTTDIYQTPFEKAKAANEAGADFFISFHRQLICLKIPTAGVKGVCPLSAFFNAAFKFRYKHLALICSTLLIAFSDITIIEIPGGQANAF